METNGLVERVAITGKTFPVRGELKLMGGRWDAGKGAWMVPAEKAEEAWALVGGKPENDGQYRQTWGRSTGRPMYWRTSGGSGVSCGCEDYPCCGH
jgi:hypothetical protein